MSLLTTFADALSKGTCFAMEHDPKIVVLGIGTQYPSGIFGTTNEAYAQFGPTRVFDTPAMENSLTGIAAGIATAGFKPLLVHARADFMLLSFDPIINLIAKWKYMFGGNAGNCPVVIRSIIGRGWGQGATHSQSFHSMLGHVPGLRVLMPYSVQDARDMICESLLGEIPTIIFEHRSLFSTKGQLLNDSLKARIPLNVPKVVKQGHDITMAGYSFAVHELILASNELELEGISTEVIDLRSLHNLNIEVLRESVLKTGYLLLHDVSWKDFGATAEIISKLAEMNTWNKAKVIRIGLPMIPAPASEYLEDVFYPSTESIVSQTLNFLGKESSYVQSKQRNQTKDMFEGPY